MQSPVMILVVMVSGVCLKMSAIEWKICLGWWSMVFSWRLAKKTRKCHQKSVIATTMKFEVGFKKTSGWLASSKEARRSWKMTQKAVETNDQKIVTDDQNIVADSNCSGTRASGGYRLIVDYEVITMEPIHCMESCWQWIEVASVLRKKNIMKILDKIS